MAISFLQRNLGGGAAAATLQVSFAGGITAGSIIVAAGSFNHLTTSVAVDDGNGDAATVAVPTTTGTGVPNQKYWCSAFLSPTAGSITITATYSGTISGTIDMFIWEISGLTSAQVDKTANTGNALTTTADSGPTGTLSASAEAAIAYGTAIVVYNGTPGAGWSNANVEAHTGSMGEEQVLSSNASIDGTGTVTAAGWDMLVATFMSGTTTLGGMTPRLRMRRKVFGWVPPLVDHRRRVLRSNRALWIPPKLLLPPKRKLAA